VRRSLLGPALTYPLTALLDDRVADDQVRAIFETVFELRAERAADR